MYMCCIQISHISLESNPRQCDKNSCLKKTTQPSSPHGHMSTALVMRLETLEQGLLTLATPFPLPDVHTSTPSQLMQLPGPPPPSHKCKPHSDCTTAATRNTRTPNPTQLPSAISSPKVRLDRKWTRPEVVIILQLTTEVRVIVNWPVSKCPKIKEGEPLLSWDASQIFPCYIWKCF